MHTPVVQQGLRRRATDQNIGAGTGTGASLSRVNSFSLDTTNTTKPTTNVIVHEVVPTDTLAGVALKYGIQVSALRKHNRLWHNDSIHTRRKVYIPLSLCSPATSSVPATRSPSLDSDRGSQPIEDITSGDNTNYNNKIDNTSTTINSPQPPSITKVPTAQLTYFPPPANDPTLLEPASPSKTYSFRQQSPPSPPDPASPQEETAQSSMAAMWSSVATTFRSTNLQAIRNRIADDLEIDLSNSWLPSIVRRDDPSSSSKQKRPSTPKNSRKSSPHHSPVSEQTHSQTSSMSPRRTRTPAYSNPTNTSKNSNNYNNIEFEQELRTL